MILREQLAEAPSHYAGDHHGLSLVDHVGERVDESLRDEMLQRDPDFIARSLPALDAALRYFAPTVEGVDRIPEGPVLLVANHSGGVYMPDYWAFLREWVRQRGADMPLYSLGFDLLFAIPGACTLARRFGSVPASHANADRLLDAGVPVLVYPGGDRENYRPWTDRHRVDFHRANGFIRLALRHRVPVVPVVSHGSHDALIVLARGSSIAHQLGIDRLRIKVFPIVFSLPFGVAPIWVPTWPLPAKVVVRVCEPFDWSELPEDAADDPHTVRVAYEEIVGRMQATLDDLVADMPHPVLERAKTAVGLGRRRREEHA